MKILPENSAFVLWKKHPARHRTTAELISHYLAKTDAMKDPVKQAVPGYPSISRRAVNSSGPGTTLHPPENLFPLPGQDLWKKNWKRIRDYRAAAGFGAPWDNPMQSAFCTCEQAVLPGQSQESAAPRHPERAWSGKVEEIDKIPRGTSRYHTGTSGKWDDARIMT